MVRKSGSKAQKNLGVANFSKSCLLTYRGTAKLFYFQRRVHEIKKILIITTLEVHAARTEIKDCQTHLCHVAT